MSLNWKEIALILSELPVEGSHIQGVRQPDFRSLVLELYRPGGAWALYFNLGADGSRLHSLTRRPQNPRVTQRFAEFLRARLRGGKIAGVRQIPGDRIVLFTVTRGGETTKLWVRLWGAASNIIAADEGGVILDAYFRRPKRGEETGGRYDPEAAAPGKSGDRVFQVRPRPADISFNAFIEEQYRGKEEEARRRTLLALLENRFKIREAKLHAALTGLTLRRSDYTGLETYKKFGDLIMANLHRIRKGDPWLRVEDYGEDGELEIKLDTASSPYENAEAYYQKYKKAKNGLSIVEEEICGLEHELGRLAERRQALAEERDLPRLEEAAREEKPAKTGAREKGALPGLQFLSHGFRILVGRTAAENDELLRRHVRGNDYWLHTREIGRAHG